MQSAVANSTAQFAQICVIMEGNYNVGTNYEYDTKERGSLKILSQLPSVGVIGESLANSPSVGVIGESLANSPLWGYLTNSPV